MTKQIIHKNRTNFGEGWTMCHRGNNVERTTNWRKVTCKQCLKYKSNKNIKRKSRRKFRFGGGY